MPLKQAGKKILQSMKKTYWSEKKAKSIFYAMINAWKLKKSKVEWKKK